MANGSGSFYAIWNNRTSQDLSALPVVVFGDEGGIHVVAETVRDLLRILSFDVEPSIDFERVYYYRADDHTASKQHAACVAWLKRDLGLDPIDDADAIVDAAQAKLKASFDGWLRRNVS